MVQSAQNEAAYFGSVEPIVKTTGGQMWILHGEERSFLTFKLRLKFIHFCGTINHIIEILSDKDNDR